MRITNFNHLHLNILLQLLQLCRVWRIVELDLVLKVRVPEQYSLWGWCRWLWWCKRFIWTLSKTALVTSYKISGCFAFLAPQGAPLVSSLVQSNLHLNSSRQPSGANWIQVEPCGTTWYHVVPSGAKLYQVEPNELMI